MAVGPPKQSGVIDEKYPDNRLLGLWVPHFTAFFFLKLRFIVLIKNWIYQGFDILI